jgi:hypothetical protein
MYYEARFKENFRRYHGTIGAGNKSTNIQCTNIKSKTAKIKLRGEFCDIWIADCTNVEKRESNNCKEEKKEHNFGLKDAN